MRQQLIREIKYAIAEIKNEIKYAKSEIKNEIKKEIKKIINELMGHITDIVDPKDESPRTREANRISLILANPERFKDLINKNPWYYRETTEAEHAAICYLSDAEWDNYFKKIQKKLGE